MANIFFSLNQNVVVNKATQNVNLNSNLSLCNTGYKLDRMGKKRRKRTILCFEIESPFIDKQIYVQCCYSHLQFSVNQM